MPKPFTEAYAYLNTTDLSEVEDFLDDIINDSMDMDWTSRVGARALLRRFEQLGLALAPTTGRWPPDAVHQLGDDIEYKSCGEPGSCHAMRGKVCGWWLNPVPTALVKWGYVISIGSHIMTVLPKSVHKFEC